MHANQHAGQRGNASSRCIDLFHCIRETRKSFVKADHHHEVVFRSGVEVISAAIRRGSIFHTQTHHWPGDILQRLDFVGRILS